MNMRKLLVGIVAAALLAVGGFSAMAVAQSPTTQQGSSAQEKKANGPDTDNIQLQQGDQNGPDNAGQAEEKEANGPDTDNVQQGDQTEDGD